MDELETKMIDNFLIAYSGCHKYVAFGLSC